MGLREKLPKEVQDALRKGLLKRLPLTFLPFVNQHLREWDNLFPYERQTVLRFVVYVAGLSDEEFSWLFGAVNQLEESMGVRHWQQFSTTEQTLENASLLARSEYYHEWRQAVQAVFDKVERHRAKVGVPSQTSENRLILLVIPRPLPLDPATVWLKWQGIGRPVKLVLPPAGESRSPCEILLGGGVPAADGGPAGLLDFALRRPDASAAGTWVCEAGSSLVDYLLKQELQVNRTTLPILLSYGRLSSFRETFAHELNTMRKDISDADAIMDRLRKVEVMPWCPPEVAVNPATREFIRSLYLSGNGALIYGNSFVEWAASEALRRARPSFFVAHFGVRNKPKPFTSVVLFENQDRLNPLPSVEDLAMTRRLAEAAAAVGVPLVDHVVVTPSGRHSSMLDLGVLPRSS